MFRLLKDKAISLKLKSKLILSFMLTSVFILLLFALFCVFLFHRCTMPFRRPAACTAGRLCDCSL